MIILPQGKYSYKQLPREVRTPLEILRENMKKLLQGFYYIWAYNNDLLELTTSYWYNHLDKLEQVITKLE